MDTGFLRFPIFIFIFLFCFILFSDTSIAHKPSSTDIKQSTKLSFDDEEEESVFSDLGTTTQRDANSGNIPTFNPIPTTPNGPQPPIIGQEPPYPTFGGGQQPPYPTFGGGQQPPNPTFGGGQQPPYPTFGGQQPPGGDTTTNQPPIIPGGGGGGGGNGPATTGGGTWCIANPTASETALQVALDYACGYGGADCSAIQPGGPCHDPDTVKDHASYAFNDYYQKNPAPTSCAFGGTAQLSYTDPSSGNCHYASSSTRTTTTSPPATPTLPMMTPPSTSTPIIPYTPTGPTGYGTEPPDFGSEPTGSPNSADKSSSKLTLSMVTISCVILCIANLMNLKL